MTTHTIAIVGGPLPRHSAQVVRGEIHIMVGDAQREAQIQAMYQKVDDEVSLLLTGALPDRVNTRTVPTGEIR